MTAVTVELVNSARRSTRVAHRIARSTLRPAVDAIAKVGASGPFAGTPAFRVANVAEVVLAPLRAPRGTLRKQVQFANFRAEWLWHNSIDGPSNPAGGAIVYLHGGAFVAGGLHSHRRLGARIAIACAMPLLNVDYRQLPKAHITDSVDDAYRYLLDQGFAPEKIIIAGDSAGGGLAFAAALAIRERGLAMPGAIVAIAPFADFDSTRRAAHPNDAIDPVMSAFLLSVPVLHGFAKDVPIDPAWSPVNHDFTGLPPVLIQVGSTEVLRDDAEQLAQRCAEAGVPYTLQVWDHAIHDFHVAADVLPDARAAIAEIGKFVHTIAEGKQVGR